MFATVKILFLIGAPCPCSRTSQRSPHFISRVVVRRPAAGHRRAPTSRPAGSRKTAVGSLHPLTHPHVSGFLSPAPRPPPSTSTTVTGRRRSSTKTTGRRRSSTPAPHSPPLFFHSASLRPPARPRRTTPSQFGCEVPCLMC
ncbi:hypothetical protein ZWY2020_017199 [Hordeum vulgare]|nr:hypothetical protein ZWY2020_017199 [Hordeum vulgare]